MCVHHRVEQVSSSNLQVPLRVYCKAMLATATLVLNSRLLVFVLQVQCVL